MSQLHETIEKIRSDLELDKVQSEADVETCVSALLRCLGWDPMNLDSVRRQYTVPRCRFDFALLNENEEVAFVIEAKAPGNLDHKATQQLLSYAGTAGTNLGLTTDGSDWSVYLPLAAGTPQAKLVRTVNLRTDLAEMAGGVFLRYLERGRVLSGDAHREACRDLADLSIHRVVEAGWTDLLDGPSEKLVKLITDAARTAASGMGAGEPKPRRLKDAVRAFVRRGFAFPADISDLAAQTSGPPSTGTDLPSASSRRQSPGVRHPAAWTYRGQRRVEKNVTVMYVAIFGQFYEDCGGTDFFRRLSEELSGRTRRQIAPSRHETGLQPDLFKYLRPLPGGWYLNTNLSTKNKLGCIRRACEVAGITFGTDLVVETSTPLDGEPGA